MPRPTTNYTEYNAINDKAFLLNLRIRYRSPCPGGDRGIGESYFVVVMCSDDDYLFWTYIPLRDAALLVLPHSFRSFSPRS